MKYSAFITLLLLIGTIAVGPLMRGNPLFSSPAVNTAAVTVAGIMVLAVSQASGIALNPVIAPPKIGFLTHFLSVSQSVPVALAVGHILTEYGYNPGYPVLPSTTPLTAFFVPFTIFTSYLLLFTCLIRKGWSRQWANFALVLVLMADTHGWNPNPLVIMVAIQANGFEWVYAIHLVAIALAVLSVKRVDAYLAPPPPPPPPPYGLSVDAIKHIIDAWNGIDARKARSNSKRKSYCSGSA
jgi:hypothetical protein